MSTMTLPNGSAQEQAFFDDYTAGFTNRESDAEIQRRRLTETSYPHQLIYDLTRLWVMGMDLDTKVAKEYLAIAEAKFRRLTKDDYLQKISVVASSETVNLTFEFYHQAQRHTIALPRQPIKKEALRGMAVYLVTFYFSQGSQHRSLNLHRVDQRSGQVSHRPSRSYDRLALALTKELSRKNYALRFDLTELKLFHQTHSFVLLETKPLYSADPSLK